MYRLLIFDLDGTLLDTSGTIHSVLNESLRAFSLCEISLEKTVEYVGNGARKLVERAVGEVHKELWDRVHADYSKRFASCDNSLTKPYCGMAQALGHFKRAGVSLAIVTNKPQSALERVYGEFLSKYGFCAVVGQSENSPLKPDPTSTLRIIESLNLKKEECLFVGDGETDVATAKNAGIDCASALWGFRKKACLSAAGAKLFCKSFADLENIVCGG